MYYVYKFFNKDNKLIYVGKTTNLKSRFNSHFSEGGWKEKEIYYIDYAKCKTKTDMDIYEIYYINKLKPKYNISLVNNDIFSINLPELNFIKYTNEDTNDIFHKNSNKLKYKYDMNLSLVEQRLIFMSLKYIDENKIDYALNNNYCILVKIRIKDYLKLFNINSNNFYKNIEDVIESFSQKYYENEKQYNKFVSSIIYNEDIFIYYNNESIKYILNNKVKYNFFNINIKSSYTMPLYNMIINNNTKEYKFLELKNQLKLNDNQYPLYANLKQKIINNSLKEINELSNFNIKMNEVFINRKIETIGFSIN